MKKTSNLLRRIAVLALVLLLVIAVIPSCGEKLTAYKLLVRAIEKTQALESYEVEMSSNTAVKMSGVSVNVPITAKIRVADATSDSPRMAMDMSTTMLGETVEMSLYSENNTYYMEMLGQKLKTTNEADVSSAGLGSMDAQTMLVLIPEALLANTTIEMEPNGNRAITVTMDGETFSKHYAALVESAANENMGAGTDVDNIELTEATVTYRINDKDYIVGSKISFGMSMDITVEGNTLPCSADVEMALSYINPGQTVEVSAPEGLDMYLDMSLLG